MRRFGNQKPAQGQGFAKTMASRKKSQPRIEYRKTGREREARLTDRLLHTDDAFDSNDERSWMDW